MLLAFGWRSFRCGFHHILQKSLEVFQAGRGNNNCIAPSTDIFSDPQETSARIFLEREDERLALNLNSVGLQSFFINGRLWWSVRTMAVGGWSVV